MFGLDSSFLIFLILFLGSFIHGVIGFGIGMLCMPFLLLVLPPLQAVPLLICIAFFLNLYLAVLYRKHINFSWVLPLVMVSFLGIPIGKMLLEVFPANVTKIVVGILILVVSTLRLKKIFFQGSPKSPLRYGIPILSGFLSSLIGIGGPPMILYFKSFFDDFRQFKGNLSFYFFISDIFILTYYAFTGILSTEILPFVGIGVICVFLGVTFGLLLSSFISSESSSSLVLYGLIILGSLLIVSAVFM